MAVFTRTINTQDSRMIQKLSTVTGQVPTVAPSDNHVDGTWDSLGIYIGELFMNAADGKMWCRTNNGIKEIFVVPNNAATGDMFYLGGGNIERLAIGTSGSVLEVSSGGVPKWTAKSPLQIYSETVNLTQIEMETIGSTPVLVVPAPGVGKHLLYIAGSAEVYQGTTNWNEMATFVIMIGTDVQATVGGKYGHMEFCGEYDVFLPPTVAGDQISSIIDNEGFYVSSIDGDLTGGDKLYRITVYYAII